MKFEKKINDIISLFNNKQYGKLIFEIESNFDDKEINPKKIRGTWMGARIGLRIALFENFELGNLNYCLNGFCLKYLF